MNRRFGTEFLNFKLKCEKLASKSYENYNTHLKNLEEQIQNKDKMIENLLHTIKVLTSYKGSPDIAVYEKRDVNNSHSQSFNVPLIDKNVDHNLSVSNEVDNPNSVIEDEMCCDHPTTDPVLRAINKYKNQHGICNKKMNAGNSMMDNKNPTGIKEHDTSCVMEQSESTTNKEKKCKNICR